MPIIVIGLNGFDMKSQSFTLLSKLENKSKIICKCHCFNARGDKEIQREQKDLTVIDIVECPINI